MTNSITVSLPTPNSSNLTQSSSRPGLRGKSAAHFLDGPRFFAARGKEPWAIQEVCRRFAPQTQSLHLIQEVHDDKFDYSKLTYDQLQQLDAILEQAGAEPPSPENGEGQKKAA